MRMLRMNEQEVVVKEFVDKVELVDDKGKFTGEYTTTYNERFIMATVVNGNSKLVKDIFGIDEHFSLVMYSKEVFSPTYVFDIEWLGEVNTYRIAKPKQHLGHYVYGLNQE